MAKKLLIVFFVLGLAVNALGQIISDGKTVYVTITEVKVRESPPTKGIILVSGPGKEVFTLKKDTEVVVLETRVIESVLSKTIWVKIRDLASEKKDEGWIYWGDEDKKSVNLTKKGVQ